LLFEGNEPVVIELNLPAFDELPRACVVRAFLDREVDVSDRDLVLNLVVEDSLEGAYNLYDTHISFILHRSYLCGEEARTTTPPTSKSMAFGGSDDPGIVLVL
jgi:hypothetical protein